MSADGRAEQIDVVPARIARLIEDGERVLLVLSGFPRSIVATDRRVIVAQSTASPATTRSFQYGELTGVTAHLGIFARRQVLLDGPGFPTDFFGSGTFGNSTIVMIWRLAQTRVAVDRLRVIIAEQNAMQQVGQLNE